MKNVVPDFKKRGGYIVVVIQDANTQQVLMQAYTNRQAWEMMLKCGEVVLWSTSRDELWYKGKTSGNTMIVEEIHLDCDRDTALIKVKLQGNRLACHTGEVSCFHKRVY